MKYAIYHTIQGSAGVCVPAEGWKRGETDELEEALRISAELARNGTCGYVVRTVDGAVLGPDGSWSGDGGEASDDDSPQNYVLRLPRSLVRDLDDLATREGVTPNDIVIQGLSAWVAERKTTGGR